MVPGGGRLARERGRLVQEEGWLVRRRDWWSAQSCGALVGGWGTADVCVYGWVGRPIPGACGVGRGVAASSGGGSEGRIGSWDV